MSGLFVPSQMVASARSWVGFHEGPNNANPFSLWQYGDYHEPYCDSAVCYWAYMAGFRFNGSDHGDRGYSWVTAHRRAAQAQGIWRDRSNVARPNWLVVLSFTLPDQHIEMVLSDQGGSTFATIGGNTGDAVMYRVRYRSNVVGFIALDEAGQNAVPGPPTPPPIVWKVKPMYDPPINVLGDIRASLRVGNGELLAGPLGHLYALDGAPFHGGPIRADGNPEPYWIGRQLARLELPNASEKAAGRAYVIIATSGERYAY